MKIEIDIPDYDPERGLRLKWEESFVIMVETKNGATLVKANPAGLVSLSYHLLALALPEVPAGRHIHYDDTNSLEDGSGELIIEKM
jgi:hypothetical protein